MTGWLGAVRLSDIAYWIDNPRTALELTELRRSFGRVPSDDELFEGLRGRPSLDVERLARNIILNGLREPLVLSYDKELLDGNRRYLAHRWIVKYGSPQERAKFDRVPAWVLTKEDSTTDGKLRVVTEYNFLDDFKERWSDFVKAKVLWERYDQGYTYDDLYKTYGGPGFSKAKITEFIKTYELIMEFVNAATDEDAAWSMASDEDAAWAIAAENFIWFQQLQRSNRDEMRNDDEFREAVFSNIGNGLIFKTDDLKNLKDVRRIPTAWSQFRQGNVAKAHLIRLKRKEEDEDEILPDQLMSEVVARLARMDRERLFERVMDNLLDQFHELALKVPGQAADVNRRLAYAIQLLDKLSSAEMATLGDTWVTRLSTSTDRVIRQIGASAPER